MSKLLALWAMIKALGPVCYLMADAFKYGVSKWGEGTWREQDADEHLAIAVNDIFAFRRGGTDRPYLVDAALRVAFAVAVAIDKKQQPAEYKK